MLHRLIDDAAPDSPAVICAASTFSFGELARRQRVLGALVGEMAPQGGVVAVVGDNDVGWIDAYYGVPRWGRIAHFVNHRLTPPQIAQAVDESGAGLVLAHPAVERRWTTATVTFDDLPGAGPDVAQPGADDPEAVAWRIPTSGTTGRAKVVQLTHRSLLAAVENTAAARPFTGDEVYLFPFPMCHVAGYNVVLFHSRGRPVVLLPRFGAAALVEAVNRHRVTHVSLAPTMLGTLLEHLDATAGALPTLRCVTYGSGPIAPPLLRRAMDRLGCDFAQGYGMTELSGNVAFLSPHDHRRALTGNPELLGAAGRPGPLAEVRLADDGEILVSGAQVTPGYADPADDVDGFVTIDNRRWLRTGDVGALDANGYLSIVDRTKDIVITGGENVSSREVEHLLEAHPGIAEVAVIGTPDPVWGEAVTAVVVRRSASAVTADELLAWSRERVGGFKKPRHVVLMDQLAHTSAGKIVKPELRRRLRPPGFAVPAEATTVVEVADGVLRLWARPEGTWRLRHWCACAVGRNGVAPLGSRAEGDGTTPAGVFPLGRGVDASGAEFGCFGTGADPGVAVGWHQVTTRDWWCCTPGSEHYDRLVEHQTGPGDEHLASIGERYAMAALIDARAPGRASAIFLHAAEDTGAGLEPTAGCVAIRPTDLVDVLRALTPQTWFVVTADQPVA